MVMSGTGPGRRRHGRVDPWPRLVGSLLVRRVSSGAWRPGVGSVRVPPTAARVARGCWRPGLRVGQRWVRERRDVGAGVRARRRCRAGRCRTCAAAQPSSAQLVGLGRRRSARRRRGDAGRRSPPGRSAPLACRAGRRARDGGRAARDGAPGRPPAAGSGSVAGPRACRRVGQRRVQVVGQIQRHSGKRDERLERAVAKTVAGFLNAEGGVLLIGVADDGSIPGIEDDYTLLKAPTGTASSCGCGTC